MILPLGRMTDDWFRPPPSLNTLDAYKKAAANTSQGTVPPAIAAAASCLSTPPLPRATTPRHPALRLASKPHRPVPALEVHHIPPAVGTHGAASATAGPPAAIPLPATLGALLSALTTAASPTKAQAPPPEAYPAQAPAHSAFKVLLSCSPLASWLALQPLALSHASYELLTVIDEK